MGAHSFADLFHHIRHKIECVYYGDSKENARNVSVECFTCNEVIIDFDRKPGEIVKALLKKTDERIYAVNDLPGGDWIKVVFSGAAGVITSSLHGDHRSGDRSDAYDDAIHGLESLILAHACAGINICEEKYKQGIMSALDAIGNNFV